MPNLFTRLRDWERKRQQERLEYERALWDYRMTQAARAITAVGVGIAAALTVWKQQEKSDAG